jgi:hypothetical protein
MILVIQDFERSEHFLDFSLTGFGPIERGEGGWSSREELSD